jgi:hypothetical protein
MPLVLAYLTAALDEHPTDGSFRELLRAYQYLNHTSEAPQSPMRLTGTGPGLAEQLESIAGGEQCDVDKELGFQHKLERGMPEYQRALYHVREALKTPAQPKSNLQRGAACLTSLLRKTQGQASKPKCEAFQRGLWFTYNEPFLATMIVRRTSDCGGRRCTTRTQAVRAETSSWRCR